MGVPFLDQGPMRAEEYYAFTDTRPDGEKWELIDGEPILNPTPSYLHQKIVRNLLVLLDGAARRSRGGWEVLPGLGVRLSDTSIPEPDVLIRPDRFIDGQDCDDMIIAFEVLSPSTAMRDLRWKRTAYASLPTLRQYVVLAQDAVDILSFDCETGADGFSERRFTRAGEDFDLPAIGVRAGLKEIYRGLGFEGI
ncbi:MAG: Uma2 family endonuclease [Methylocystis sp.]